MKMALSKVQQKNTGNKSNIFLQGELNTSYYIYKKKTMKFDIRKEIEKAAITHLKDITRKALTAEEFKKATFSFN